MDHSTLTSRFPFGWHNSVCILLSNRFCTRSNNTNQPNGSSPMTPRIYPLNFHSSYRGIHFLLDV